jgi:hypothetical protein
MAQVISVLSLGVLLAITALVWSGERLTNVNTGVASASLSISDIMLKVDAKSLPVQEFDDQAVVFSAHND